MIDPCPPRFEKHNLFRINEVGQARDFLGAYGFGFEADKPGLDLRLNCACLGNTAVIYMQTGAPAALTHPDDDLFWVLLPVRETIEAVAGEQVVQLGPARGAVTSARRSFSLKTVGHGTNFAVGLREQTVRRRLVGLLGEDPGGALAFAPAMDLVSRPGSRFARHMRHMAMDFFQGGPIFDNPLSASAFEDFMVCELLLEQPHTYADQLRRLDRRIAPRDMRRAAEYIDAHLDAPLSIGEVAAAAGVAGRTLYKHFQELRGTSPMRYVRERRFERARQALLRAGPTDSVTEIATQWGFSHLGRFAVEYRKRFAETPSETLRRRARRPH